jgi:hypothetical protein
LFGVQRLYYYQFIEAFDHQIIMKTITLTISDIGYLNSIQACLYDNRPISANGKVFLAKFLSQLPNIETILLEKPFFNEAFEIKVWHMKAIEVYLEKWIALFDNIPGFDYCPCCLLVGDAPELLQKKVIMVAPFAPSMSYNLDSSKDGYEILIKDDGTALFHLPTLEDAELFPELYNFKGSWLEAYLLLIETLKKGWPMEEFPEELLPLLKK